MRRLEVGMIEARPAMQQHKRRALAHVGPIGDKLRAFDIEKEAYTANINFHLFASYK
jgi:hypothetical protein